IRILVVILLVHQTCCQDGYSDRDILRYQQMAANEGQLAAIAGYSNNIVQRDPTSQTVSSVNEQYHMTDDTANSDYHRADRTRTRKVYRIKNPFQHQLEDNRQDGNLDPRDSSTGASNQYASMQYSLPPEEFLRQIRGESLFYQQPTPAPNLGYTATPQPQYQYSTVSPSSYDNTIQLASQIPQLEAKSHTQYLTNTFQYNSPNTFSFDGVQSTPSPVTPFISTALPSGQFVSTPSNSYVSSASSIFLSSPPNLQYVSSPLSAIQTGSPEYSSNTRVTTTLGSNALNYDNNDQNKKLEIDHYDNSANGIRYPISVQRQYQNEYGSSTPVPTASPDSRDQWQNNMNNVNAAAKSLQDVTYTQYQNYPYNQQDNRADSNEEHSNSETHRIGNMPSANNIYLNYMQPEYQVQSNQVNSRSRTRDLEQQTGQPDYYTNGEYGWKLEDKKQPTNNDAYSSEHYRYQSIGLQSDNGEAVSQMNFHMDTGKQYNNYDQKNKYLDSSTQNNYYNQQPDLITASPYYYSRDNNIDNKQKPSFDHAKALKNIVPIDVSNVVSHSESQKGIVNDDNNRYRIQNYAMDQLDRQQYRPLTDSYFKDKNAVYGLNIKTKQDEYQGPESPKLFDPNSSNYGKQQQSQQEPTYTQSGFSGGPQRISYISQSPGNAQDNLQSSANIQQQGLQRPQNQMPTDINSILKLNDVPYQLTQNFSPDALKFHSVNFDRGSIPSPLPVRINQDVGMHQLDVTSNLLSKLMLKQPGLNLNRPDLDPQTGSLVSTINGFKVANPYNVDLKLVADMLKGKSSVDDHILSFRDQYSKPTPLKLDLSQLQLLLKNDNVGSLAPVSDGLNVLSNPFLEIYNSGRYPYQKYSRSQEEEEPLVPIADASSHHPIGAVMEQDDPTNEQEDSTAPESNALSEGSISVNHEDNRPKKRYHSHRSVSDRHRHPNSLLSGRYSYQKRYPKAGIDEPYPLLKPPPLHSMRGRGSHIKLEKHSRRRRLNKPKIFRVMKAEPLFEAETEGDSYESPVSVVLRPPAPVIESKSDVNVDDNDNSS
ncbi:Uncharacterized protein OBRU01_23457, partial [Operophtera brumata]